MKDEISAAVVFISRFLKRNKHLNHKQVEKFSDHLSAILLDRFKDHWHTDAPEKGQAYRYIIAHFVKKKSWSFFLLQF